MTDARPTKAAPRLRLTAREWRLYLVTVLASVYLLAWRAIAVRPPRASAPEAPSTSTTDAPPASVVWLDEVPAAVRPPLSLPSGWRVATGTGAAAVASPRPRRVPAKRPVRIRTRSS